MAAPGRGVGVPVEREREGSSPPLSLRVRSLLNARDSTSGSDGGHPGAALRRATRRAAELTVWRKLLQPSEFRLFERLQVGEVRGAEGR
eukprot:3249727-Rhodomonas_salina.1